MPAPSADSGGGGTENEIKAGAAAGMSQEAKDAAAKASADKAAALKGASRHWTPEVRRTR